MANTLFTSFKKNLLKKVLDLVNDTFKIGLLSAYTITASDTVWGSLTGATETTNSTGSSAYTAGGLALSGLAVTNSGTTAVWTSTANPSWTSATFSAAYAVIYDTTVSNALVGVLDFGSTQSVIEGTFTIEWASSPVAGSILTLA
jgi:hypothetical protein